MKISIVARDEERLLDPRKISLVYSRFLMTFKISEGDNFSPSAGRSEFITLMALSNIDLVNNVVHILHLLDFYLHAEKEEIGVHFFEMTCNTISSTPYANVMEIVGKRIQRKQ